MKIILMFSKLLFRYAIYACISFDLPDRRIPVMILMSGVPFSSMILSRYFTLVIVFICHPLSKIEVFSFLETVSMYLLYCPLIVYTRCQFQKHKFFIFWKWKPCKGNQLYPSTHPVIQIGLLDYTLYPEHPEFYSTYQVTVHSYLVPVTNSQAHLKFCFAKGACSPLNNSWLD